MREVKAHMDTVEGGQSGKRRQIPFSTETNHPDAGCSPAPCKGPPCTPPMVAVSGLCTVNSSPVWKLPLLETCRDLRNNVFSLPGSTGIYQTPVGNTE